MALVLGTNVGFVTVAPSSDPGGTITTGDGVSTATKDISPSTAAKITEIGWWLDDFNESEESNFEVGLYAADGSGGGAGTLIHVSRTNAKGTSGGVWKTVSVDWEIDGDTNYWLGLQIDDTATFTAIDLTSSGASGRASKSSQSTLTDPYGTPTASNSDGAYGIYALWEAAAPAGFTRKIKIAGTFVDKPIKTKVGGVFVDKPIKIKVGGTFQDA